jgi:hypothetical protein
VASRESPLYFGKFIFKNCWASFCFVMLHVGWEWVPWHCCL